MPPSPKPPPSNIDPSAIAAHHTQREKPSLKTIWRCSVSFWRRDRRRTSIPAPSLRTTPRFKARAHSFKVRTLHPSEWCDQSPVPLRAHANTTSGCECVKPLRRNHPPPSMSPSPKPPASNIDPSAIAAQHIQLEKSCLAILWWRSLSLGRNHPSQQMWVVRVGGDDEELRPWHYVYSIERKPNTDLA